jgi:hypothetical protein
MSFGQHFRTLQTVASLSRAEAARGTRLHASTLWICKHGLPAFLDR